MRPRPLTRSRTRRIAETAFDAFTQPIRTGKRLANRCALRVRLWWYKPTTLPAALQLIFADTVTSQINRNCILATLLMGTVKMSLWRRAVNAWLGLRYRVRDWIFPQTVDDIVGEIFRHACGSEALLAEYAAERLPEFSSDERLALLERFDPDREDA